MRLSIYVGLRAIAWVVSENGKIVKHGVNRVAVEFDNYYEYIAGNPITLRVNRRVKRQARRNLWRYNSRRENLKYFLKNNGITSKKSYSRNEILKLRVKALDGQLTNEELYHVLLSLQTKRGYKSLRGVSDNEKSDYLKTIAEHEANRLKYKSIADYLLSLPTSKNIIFNRASYEQEYWSVIKNQNLTDELKQKIFQIIYFQRPLKKGAISFCKVEKGRKVAHASNPLFQEFRCYRDAMNIIVWDKDLNEIDIPNDIKLACAERLIEGKNVTKAQVCKSLGLKKVSDYSWLSGKQLIGNPVAGISVELWQDLFSAVESEQLKELISKKYDFSDYEVQRLVDLDLHKLGYADYSIKAVRRLLPELKQCKKLSEAVLDLYGKVEMKDVALRNVVLEKHFDSYKAIIERLKKEYPITETSFEIDYLLKAGNKQRKDAIRNTRANEKLLKENNLENESYYNQLKFQLWKESEGISPYEPDYIIPLEELFTEKYNLDHIIPKSKLFETGNSNMVLSPTNLNEQKGRKTAYEFATTDLKFSDSEWKEVAEKFGRKKELLLMQDSEIPTDWISKRQNSDYNTKCFGTLADVNIPNKLINRFQGLWNLRKYDEQDCRYYLYKAFVLANLSQETVNRFDNIKEIKQSAYDLPLNIDLPTDFENVIPFFPTKKLVRKNQYGYYPSAQLHQETIHGKRVINGETFYKVRQPLSKLTDRMLKNIYAKDIQIAIQEWVDKCGDIKEAVESLEESPFVFRDNIVTAVSVKMTSTDLYNLRSKKGGVISKKTDGSEPVDFVYSDTNYALELTKDDKGKIQKRLITLLEHCDNLNDKKEPYKGVLIRKNDSIMYENELHYFIGCGNDNLIRNVYHLNASKPIQVTGVMYEQIYNERTK